MKRDPFFSRIFVGNPLVFRAMGVRGYVYARPPFRSLPIRVDVYLSLPGTPSVQFSSRSLLDAMLGARVHAFLMVRDRADRMVVNAREIRDPAKRDRALRKAERIRESARWFGIEGDGMREWNDELDRIVAEARR